MFKDLKEDIIKEFTKVEEVLHTCKLAGNPNVINPFILKTEDLFTKDKKDIDQFLKSITKHFTNEIIYKIELQEVTNKKQITESFQKAKANKIENRAFCKFNKENKEAVLKENGNSVTLYIGSSNKKGIYNRIRCHLGLGAKGTYAMHLISWLPTNTKNKISITFLELTYNESPTLKTNVLELVEQALWHREQPLLGKKSGLL